MHSTVSPTFALFLSSSVLYTTPNLPTILRCIMLLGV